MNCPKCHARTRQSTFLGYNHEPEFDTPEFMGNWKSINPIFVIAGSTLGPVEIRVHESETHPWVIRIRHRYRCHECGFEWDEVFK